jgi:hypothetical protein
MKNLLSAHRFPASLLTLALLAAHAGFAQTAPVPAPTAEPVVTLSPFEVNTSRDQGFVAASSLAGGRLATDLVDTPVAYSVQTREFLDALNLSDLNEAINWTVSATTTPDDGGGQLFGGTGSSTIRGVGSNAVNRNFFTGGSNPSTYNLERMDYARGPNSILFGTGTISGTSNAVVKSARLGRNATEVRAEIGSWESYRATVDANYSLNKKLAARVVTTWQDTHTFRDWEHTQRRGVSPSLTVEPTRTTRISLIGDYYEQKVTAGMNALNDALSGWDGRTVYSGLQPSTLPSQSAFGASRVGTNSWVVSPASGRGFDTALSYTGLMQTTFFGGNRSVNGVTAASGTNLGFNGGPLIDTSMITPGIYDAAIAGSAFRVPSRSFTNIGPNPTAINRFRDATLFVDQRIGDSLNVQLSGAVNKLFSYGLIDYYTNQGYQNTYIDINRLLPDGVTNPNFLQPYNEFSRPERQKVDTTNRALRFAAAYSKSTRWFDLRANLIGAHENQEIFRSREYYMIPVDADARAWGLVTSTRTQTLRYRYYWNQRERELTEMKSITLVDPTAGTSRTFNPLWVLGSDRNDATTFSDATTKYYQASANVSFWQKRLIVLGAFRADQVDRSQRLFLRPLDHPAGYGALTRDHFIYRPNAPEDYFKLTYVPKNAAGRRHRPVATRPRHPPARHHHRRRPPAIRPRPFPRRLQPAAHQHQETHQIRRRHFQRRRGVSLWANFAQTFNPTDFTRTTIDYGTPPPSVSEGKDYGVRVSFGPKLYVTLSRYESKENDASITQPSGFSNLQVLINANAIGDLTSDGRNRRGLGDVPIGWNDTLDRKSRGYEFEAVANLTPHWRLTLNAGLADASQTDAYRQTRAWVDAQTPTFKQILDDSGIQLDAGGLATAKPGVTTANSPDLNATVNAWNSLQANRANWVSGTQLLNRLTKYTANAYTDYRFSRGKLSGLRLGYGMQFRGPQVIGYRGADTMVNPANRATAIDDPNVDAYTVVWQKAYFLGTATIGYPVKIARHKIDFNLSITNLFNYDTPLYNSIGLRAREGDLTSPARVSYPRYFSYTTPRSFRLSATKTF